MGKRVNYVFSWDLFSVCFSYFSVSAGYFCVPLYQLQTCQQCHSDLLFMSSILHVTLLIWSCSVTEKHTKPSLSFKPLETLMLLLPADWFLFSVTDAKIVFYSCRTIWMKSNFFSHNILKCFSMKIQHYMLNGRHLLRILSPYSDQVDGNVHHDIILIRVWVTLMQLQFYCVRPE